MSDEGLEPGRNDAVFEATLNAIKAHIRRQELESVHPEFTPDDLVPLMAKEYEDQGDVVAEMLTLLTLLGKVNLTFFYYCSKDHETYGGTQLDPPGTEPPKQCAECGEILHADSVGCTWACTLEYRQELISDLGLYTEIN